MKISSDVPSADTSGEVILELPPKGSISLTFSENPLRVVNSELGGEKVVGYFVCALRIDKLDLEICNLRTASDLSRFLSAHSGLHRRLILSPQAPAVFPPTDGCVYFHKNLPTEVDLGLVVKGFSPPRIESVAPKSPLAGRVQSGQAVHALMIPGLEPLSLMTPGFTGDSVQTHLIQSSSTPGRVLVTKDVVYIDTIKPRSGRREVGVPGEAGFFDFGGLNPFRRTRK